MSAGDRDILAYYAPGDLRAREFTPDEAEVLDRVNRKIAGSPGLETMIDLLFEATAGVCPCDRISTAFLEDEGERLVSHYTRASYGPVLLDKGYAEEMAGSSLRKVLDQDLTRVIRNLPEYLSRHSGSGSTRLLVQEGVRSSMTCPLKVEDRIVGVLFRSSQQPDAYGEHQVALHLAVAERLSQAVEKAYRIEQLGQAIRGYLEMLGFLSHELRSPLAGIVTDTRLILDGYLGGLEEAQKDKLTRTLGKAEFLLSLVGDYLDLARIEGGGLQMRPRTGVDLAAEVIRPALLLVGTQMEERRMRLEEDLPSGMQPVECDPGLVKIVLVNLLGNAAKYGDEDGLIRLKVDQTAGSFAISVWNTGPGFPPSQRPRLFRKFSRLETPELKKRKGTGVGLYTSWRVVRLHGGSIEADSREGEWAEFRFRIPQPLSGGRAED